MTIKHIWRQPTFSKHEWNDICDDFGAICAAYPEVVYYSMKADAPPEINGERIVFNGPRGKHSQPMCLTRLDDNEKARGVCETRGLPYDAFATALLLIARYTIERRSLHPAIGESFRIVSTSPWHGWTIGHGHGIVGGVRLVTDILGYPPGYIVDFHQELVNNSQFAIS